MSEAEAIMDYIYYKLDISSTIQDYQKETIRELIEELLKLIK